MKKWLCIGLGSCLALALTSCVENEDAVELDDATSHSAQAVTVTPEFSISGTQGLPDELVLTELGLAIAEIRLEPLTVRSGSVGYTTRNPFRLTFDVAKGEVVKTGTAVEIPEAGRFLVSIRLEPTAVDGESGERTWESSFNIAGFVAGDGVSTIDSPGGSSTQDGNPLPLPFDEINGEVADDDFHDRSAQPQEWTPFHYDSHRAVFYTLADVELVAGHQVLRFNFDVNDWALELVEPIIRAVRNGQGPAHSEHGVDITSQLDGSGRGAEALMDNASVRSEVKPLGL